MKIIKAATDDCRSIAELALMAGEGIPAYFWEQTKLAGQDILDAGAQNAASETDNFSYKNVHLALVENEIAGMLLAYRLPDSEKAGNLDGYPEFIRPLIELEQCVPNSFYINMLASYPKYRGLGIGTALMGIVDKLAVDAGCKEISVEVFEQNEGALRLYKRLGYKIIEHRDVVAHPCVPHDGKILLLSKAILTEVI